MKKYTCIESFCGAGGLGLGLHNAGFEIVKAFDWNEYAVETYRANLSDKCIVANAMGVSGLELIEGSNVDIGDIDLFAGGPPCQGFSKQKRGAHLGDDRNLLVLEYVRLVREILPRFFLLENVSMLGQKRGKLFVDTIKEQLRNYTLYPHFYNCADYGLAQTRERFVIVGRREDIKAPFRGPKPIAAKWRTVGAVIGDLPEPPADYSKHPYITNHYKSRITKENELRFSFVPQGGGWQNIPMEYRLPCHQTTDTKKGGWPDVYGRLEWDKQAPTITGGFDSFTRGRYGHPTQNRAITPREAARLQGFPDSYHFLGNRHEVRHQIGNAVPPPLAEAIGLEIMKSLRFAESVQPYDEDAFEQTALFKVGD